MLETSIIIRTFNEEKHIENLLKAIKKQDYSDYEIVLVDSGSTDSTLKIARSFCDNIIEIESRDFTFGYSLNVGCKHAQGKYLVMVSAHTLPSNRQWLSNLIKHFKDEKVAMVYGKQLATKSTRFSEEQDFKKLFGNSFLKLDNSSYYANNANSAIRKKIWQEHNFDEDLFGLEDIESAKYITEKGFNIVYEPKAAMYHIHNEDWNQVYNRYRREAIAARQIGIVYPPQVNPKAFWLIENIFKDFFAILPNFSFPNLKDIIHFRYTQWLGTRRGWYHDVHIDINKEKHDLYYPSGNEAVVISGKSQVNFQKTPFPEIKPSDVLIQVAYVGVCGTDLDVYDGTLGYYNNGMAKYPIIPGHEFSGTIIKTGANSRDKWKLGDRVIGECILSCGECLFCLKGSNVACDKRREVGVMNYNGAYAQFIALPANHVHKISNNLDLKTASLAEPLAVVLRALRRIESRIKPNDKCAVIGAGPIGNLCAQVLSSRGHKVTAFDRDQSRLELLKENIEVSNEIKNLNNFDLIVEAAGSVDALKSVLTQSRADSTILLLGFPYGDINYNFENIVGNEKFIVGSVGGASQDFKKALELLPQINTSHFTEKVLPLNEFLKAWELQRSLKYLKIILKV